MIFWLLLKGKLELSRVGGYRNRCKTERCQLLLCDTNSCTVPVTKHTQTCAHTMSKSIYLKLCVCRQGKDVLPTSDQQCLFAQLLHPFMCSPLSSSLSHSLWMTWGDYSYSKWQAVLSQLSAQAAVDEPRWKVAKAITSDGLLTALTSVLHIFLRIPLLLSVPFTAIARIELRAKKHAAEIVGKAVKTPQFHSFWDEASSISSFLILQTSSLKVPRCSHINGSTEIGGAASPSGTEEVLMCEMC